MSDPQERADSMLVGDGTTYSRELYSDHVDASELFAPIDDAGYDCSEGLVPVGWAVAVLTIVAVLAASAFVDWVRVAL